MFAGIKSFIVGIILLSCSFTSYGQELCNTAQGKIDECIVYLLIDKVDVETGAVVQISATGFMIGSDGWILTAAHSLINKMPLEKDSSGNFLPAREAQYPPPIKGRLGKRIPVPEDEIRLDQIDHDLDVALLQFKTFSNAAKILTIGRASEVVVNQTILRAIGFPLDKELDIRDVKVSSKSGTQWNLDGGLTFGFSGAPLITANGSVVGFVTGDDSRGPELKYATPINLVLSRIGSAEPNIVTGSTSSNVGVGNKNILKFQFSRQDVDADEEERVVRAHVWAAKIPENKDIYSAAVVIKKQQGLKRTPALDIAARNVSVIFELESGPLSTKRRGYVEGELEVTVVPAER